MSEKIQIRRDTAPNWTTANPILAQGEQGFESQGTNPETYKIKIGDGINNWVTLPYFTPNSETPNIMVSFTTATNAQTTITIAGAKIQGCYIDGMKDNISGIGTNTATFSQSLIAGEEILTEYYN